VRFHVQRRKPRDQRRNYKTRCGEWNKSKIRDFASAKYGLELDFIEYRPHSSRMKIVAASMALALLLLTSGGVSVANTSSDTAEEGIRRLNVEEVDAFLKNDRSAMARLWPDDFVVTNPLNKLVTKQQVLGMVDSGFLVITSFDRQIEYLRVYGDFVVVVGREVVVWGGRMPNAGKSENLRFTAVWMKQGGRWQQIARHANIVPSQPAVSPP
jgi:ketosteroid isomerase-like protein